MAEQYDSVNQELKVWATNIRKIKNQGVDMND